MPEHGPEVIPAPFLGFFDDAAVFPPGLAPLETAVTDHVARRATELAAAVGPLVLPLKDLARAKELAAQELSANLDRGNAPVQVSVVTPAGQLQDALAAAGTAGPELEVVTVELKTSLQQADWSAELAEAAWAAGQLQIFTELTAAQVADGALEQLAGTGLRLKFRTGGIEAGLFPSPAQLAAVLAAAVRQDIPFKLTAGLHQAVRYTNPATGFTHHGFLNIALATGLAQDGADESELESVLLETDPKVLADRFAALPGDWRRSFTSFGTCSVAEPAESLEDLAIFRPGTAASAHLAQKVNHA
jgi:hypothetical protein